MPNKNKEIKLPQGWGKHELSEGEPSSLAIGPLRIALKKVQNEIWIATTCHEGEFEESGPAESLDDQKWGRWALKSEVSTIHCLPCFPDKPVLMKPEHPLNLTVGSSIKIYVRIPVWVRILTPGDENSLTEIPSVVLSNTWFGSFTEGELCYWLSSRAQREPVIETDKQHMIICPVEIRNAAKENLLVDQLRLRVDSLSIYRLGEQFWASPTKVSYRGGKEASQVEVSQNPPSEASEGQLITSPRDPVHKRFQLRSFGKAWSLPGLGFLDE